MRKDIEMAKQLLNTGAHSLKNISLVSGLTVEELKQVQAECKAELEYLRDMLASAMENSKNKSKAAAAKELLVMGLLGSPKLEQVSQITGLTVEDLKVTRAEYRARMDFLSTRAADLENSREEGREEGLVEGEKIGLEKGRAEIDIEITKNCLKMGLSIEQIAQATGLTVERVKELQKAMV